MTTELEELMNAQPPLDSGTMDKIILELRKQRARYELGEKPTKIQTKTAEGKTQTSVLDIDSLVKQMQPAKPSGPLGPPKPFIRRF